MLTPAFVWIPRAPRQRLTHAYFRRDLRLDAAPGRAQMHLFARTHYQLHVNGHCLGTGPARSYPEFPEYDTYDLAPFLRKGANAIAVHVQHSGLGTYHHLATPGAFAAWGEIVLRDGRKVPLATPHGWRCRPAGGYEPNPPRFSFASGPIQFYDERRDPPGWNLPGRAPGRWHRPVRLDDALGGHRLVARTIPPLTQEELLPKELLAAQPLRADEEILSFRVAQPLNAAGGFDPKQRAFAYTFIRAPRAGRVTVGAYWGEHVLNGRDLRKEAERPDAFARNDIALDLRKGWNFFFVSCGLVQGVWEFHLAVPRAAGLTFCARRGGSDAPFRVAGPLPDTEAEPLLKRGPPAAPEDLPELVPLWRDAPRPVAPASPAKGLAWAMTGDPLPIPSHQVSDIELPAGADHLLRFDMGDIGLGRIFVEFDAPRGTVVDVGYAEDLRHGRPWYFKSVMVANGERHIARGGASRLETYHRRGFRFLEVAVRGARGPVHVRRVGMVSERYPCERAGRFECSDPFFNTLWAYGWLTLRNCSEDVITDCPWRERTLYGGDLLPETATTAVATGDLRLVRRSVEVLLQSQDPETGGLRSHAPTPRGQDSLSDYPLLTLLIAEWYIRLTGDAAFARRCVPVFRRMMRALATTRDAAGLYPAEPRVFVDWVKMTKQGRVCTLQALASRAFDAWAGLLESVGRHAEAGGARRTAEEARRAMVRHFWDGSKNAFSDSRQPTGLEQAWSISSNAWPLMFTRLTATVRRAVVDHLRRELAGYDAAAQAKTSEGVSTYGAFYLLGALYESGAEGFAETCMRSIYSEMVRNPSGTIWEGPSAVASLNHAWSTAPNYYLSTRALGVRLGFPETTRLDRVLIAPQSETLQWARGVVPHPRGPVEVDWRVEGDTLRLRYRAPRGVRVEVRPVGRLAALRRVVTVDPARA